MINDYITLTHNPSGWVIVISCLAHTQLENLFLFSQNELLLKSDRKEKRSAPPHLRISVQTLFS